jgi:hypothetical protein
MAEISKRNKRSRKDFFILSPKTIGSAAQEIKKTGVATSAVHSSSSFILILISSSSSSDEG